MTVAVKMDPATESKCICNTQTSRTANHGSYNLVVMAFYSRLYARENYLLNYLTWSLKQHHSYCNTWPLFSSLYTSSFDEEI